MPLHLRIKTAAPAPISFAPSQEWRGNDGSWSTFVVRIGSPEQVFEVLISTTSQEIWVVGVGRCSQMATADCGMLQGVWPFRNAPSSGFQTNAVSLCPTHEFTCSLFRVRHVGTGRPLCSESRRNAQLYWQWRVWVGECRNTGASKWRRIIDEPSRCK